MVLVLLIICQLRLDTMTFLLNLQIAIYQVINSADMKLYWSDHTLLNLTQCSIIYHYYYNTILLYAALNSAYIHIYILLYIYIYMVSYKSFPFLQAHHLKCLSRIRLIHLSVECMAQALILRVSEQLYLLHLLWIVLRQEQPLWR